MNDHSQPSSAAPTAIDPTTDIDDIFRPIATELAAVERKLADVYTHSDKFIDGLLKHGGLLGGKRLRPALVLLIGKACGSVDDRHIALSVALEMIHTATLVHDDILDEADVRRHVETLHRRWNLEASVLFGDYLLSHSFYVCGNEVGGDYCTLIADATNRVCEGEMKQVASRGEFEMPLQKYMEIIEGKTAALCRCAARGGAMLASASEDQIESASDFGTDLGVAFQIADDVLDLQGDEQQTGKSTGRDYEMGKPTLPLILALENADKDERHLMVDRLRDERVSPDELCVWLERHEAIPRAQAMARARACQAADRLDRLTGCPASIASLRALTESAVNRQR